MKALRISLFFLGMLLFSPASFSQQINWQGILFDVVNDEPPEVRLTSARRCMATFTVPRTVAYHGVDYSVKVLGYQALSYLNCIYHLDLSEVEIIEDGYAQYYSDNGTTRYHGSLVDCTQLESLKAQQVKEVGDYAFYGCLHLPEIDLPKGERIGKSAFRNCAALETVTLGEQMQSLGEYSFWDSPAIKEIFVWNNQPPQCSDSVFSETVYRAATLWVPKGTKTHYEQAAGWKNFDRIVENESAGITLPTCSPSPTVRFSTSTLEVNGVPKGKSVRIYTIEGKLVKSFVSTGAPLHFRLRPGHCYLVKTEGRCNHVQM